MALITELLHCPGNYFSPDHASQFIKVHTQTMGTKGGFKIGSVFEDLKHKAKTFRQCCLCYTTSGCIILKWSSHICLKLIYKQKLYVLSPSLSHTHTCAKLAVVSQPSPSPAGAGMCSNMLFTYPLQKTPGSHIGQEAPLKHSKPQRSVSIPAALTDYLTLTAVCVCVHISMK